MTAGTPTAFAHPKLTELIQQAGATPFIGALLIQTLRDLIHPQDRILGCYYRIETADARGDQTISYYSIEVALVTTAFFIRILFFPKTHMFVKKRIHAIADLKVEYPAPPMEALAEIRTAEFNPSRVSLSVGFTSDKGDPVETWTAEASSEDQVRQLMELSRVLGRIVGMPLNQATSAVQPS